MRVPAPMIAVTAMVSVQLGAALSTHLFTALTPAGTAWARLVVAAMVLLVATRPPVRTLARRVLATTVVLGAVTGLLMLTFIEAVARIPLGTAAAIEFLGPLTVAAARSHRRAALIWPAMGAVGVLTLTRPWVGHLNITGIGFALAAAALWGTYIVLTQRVGAEIEGLHGLAISLTGAALVTTPFGAAAALHGLTPPVAAGTVAVALFSPLIPFALEMVALRRMTLPAFGTLMALEPGVAAILGLVVLAQRPNGYEAVGIVLVVTAGIGAQRAQTDRPG